MSLEIKSSTKAVRFKICGNRKPFHHGLNLVVNNMASSFTRFIDSVIESNKRYYEYIQKYTRLYAKEYKQCLDGDEFIENLRYEISDILFILFNTYEGLWKILPENHKQNVERKGYTTSNEISCGKFFISSLLREHFLYDTELSWRITNDNIPDNYILIESPDENDDIMVATIV